MTDAIYENYWTRKKLRANCPHFPVIATSGKKLDGDVLRVTAQALRGKTRLLDVGAGSLEVRDALLAVGFSGAYETLDVGTEYRYTYQSIEEVSGRFDAILLLDVVEHLSLADGLSLLRKLVGLLGERGVLIVQTPNGRCVRSPFSSDMTHVHSYNLPDLWAFLKALDCDTEGYRVAFRQGSGLVNQMLGLASRAVVTRLLGLDYADNILLIATNAAPQPA
jgi:hypothetical protein